MLKSVVRYDDVPRSGLSGAAWKALSIIVQFLEKKTGAHMLIDEEVVPFGKTGLADVFEIAEKLRHAGVIQALTLGKTLSDEPKLLSWRATFRDGDENSAGAGAVSDERHSLIATLAEALERHIWFERDDYFESPIVSTPATLKKTHLSPTQFAGLDIVKRRDALEKKEFLWIRGTSLISNSYVWVPAQTISAHPRLRARRQSEPLLRSAVTTGLATHEDQARARLGGLLEIIERDAYIIMWLNQLSLPRIDPETLAAKRHTLRTLLSRCDRYRLTVSFVRMITDAPTYTICAVVHDGSHMPPYTVGLKAGQDAAAAAEGALLEALRARLNARAQILATSEIVSKQKIRHENRLSYWSHLKQSEKLSFLVRGAMGPVMPEVWDTDSPTLHLERLISWCKQKSYNCVSVPFTSSNANVPSWHIEMIVVPELQPLYFDERHPHIFGARISEIPRAHGHNPRIKPFTEEPHPFV